MALAIYNLCVNHKRKRRLMLIAGFIEEKNTKLLSCIYTKLKLLKSHILGLLDCECFNIPAEQSHYFILSSLSPVV